MARRASPTGSTQADTVALHQAATDDILDTLQTELNKEFGAGTAQRLSSASTLSKVDNWVSTRSIVVDRVIAGGRGTPCSLIPFGRQTEISGLPGTGKTSLLAQIAAEVQDKGGIVVVTDTEERIDHPYWQQLGVNTDRILNLTATTLEQVYNKQLKFIKMCHEKWPNVPILMGWDSLGGTSTDSIMDESADNEDPMETAKKAMMVKARINSAGLEMLNPYIARSHVAYVYTNTLYTRPNVKYGDPMETPGGFKVKYYATLRLRLQRVGQIAEEDPVTGQKRVYGHKIQVESLKNSMAPMLIGMEGAILGGKGFCNDWTVREIAESLKLISKSGTWSTWTTPTGADVKFQGWHGFVDKVIPHAEYPELVQLVSAAL